ncbi:FST [Cordylochernes scorpioides]|uniref:FST n=1 Tax=Cordylochernes scorpioides TaxID=51811 RepID=A0ABY6KYB7_9ARAC|nr:FST [Cordylochernes scorpioides]
MNLGCVVVETGFVCDAFDAELEGTCEGVVCGPGRTCRINAAGFPRCVCGERCSKAQRRSGPVCGTDDKTYRNTCKLLRRRCRHPSPLDVAYIGTCKRRCDQITCRNNRTCLEDHRLRPHCVRCRVRCAPTRRPVCGADGVTYPSLCHLKREACKRGKAVPLAYKSPCKDEEDGGVAPVPFNSIDAYN